MEKMFREELKINGEQKLVSDKVMSEIYKQNVFLDDFKSFPKLIINNQGNIEFCHYLKHRNIKNVNESRTEYFAQRMALAEERLFSHSDKYRRAIMSDKSGQD